MTSKAYTGEPMVFGAWFDRDYRYPLTNVSQKIETAKEITARVEREAAKKRRKRSRR